MNLGVKLQNYVQLTLRDGDGDIIRCRIPVIVEYGQGEDVLSFSECCSIRDWLVKVDNVRVSRTGETTPGVRDYPMVIVRCRTVQDDPSLRQWYEL